MTTARPNTLILVLSRRRLLCAKQLVPKQSPYETVRAFTSEDRARPDFTYAHIFACTRVAALALICV
jgi:hypothetical protein